MDDLKVALEDVQEASGSATLGPVARTRSRWRWASSLFVAALLATGVFAWWRRPTTVLEPTHLVPVTTLPGAEAFPTLAPNGNYVAFTWSGLKQDNDDIYVQRLDSGAPLQLTKTRQMISARRGPQTTIGSRFFGVSCQARLNSA